MGEASARTLDMRKYQFIMYTQHANFNEHAAKHAASTYASHHTTGLIAAKKEILMRNHKSSASAEKHTEGGATP